MRSIWITNNCETNILNIDSPTSAFDLLKLFQSNRTLASTSCFSNEKKEYKGRTDI